ncbi:MAG: leucine-rich repeat protein [Eubacterium sp.]|nr:leucine-rich repeat protein [Eubacterium sp.]
MKRLNNYRIVVVLMALMMVVVMSTTGVVNAANPIDSVRVYSEYFQPVLGGKPKADYSEYYIRTARIGNNDKYSVYNYNFTLSKGGKTYKFNKGVIWEKIDQNGSAVVMTSNDYFEEGYSYKMYIALNTNGDNTFTDNLNTANVYLPIQGSEEGAVHIGDKAECITRPINSTEKINGNLIPDNHFCIVAITWNAPLKSINNYNVDVKNAVFPWDGTTASTSGLSLDNESMTICNNKYSPKWYENNNAFYSTFVSGKKYTLKIPIKIKSGYVLIPNIIYNLKDENVTINGFPAKVDYTDISDGIIYITQEYKSVKKVNLNGKTLINYPLSEDVPTFPTVVGDWEKGSVPETYYGYVLNQYAGQTAGGVDWYLENSTTPIKGTTKLTGDNTYKVRIYLKASDGYAFDYNFIQSDANKGKKTLKIYDSRDTNAAYYKDGILDTEEDGKSDTSCYGTAKTAYIEREYKVYSRVREIKLNGFVIPNIGNTPVFNISKPSSCPIEIEKSESNERITWNDVTNGGYVELSRDNVFEGGHKYEANVFFREQRCRGYAFPDNYSEVKIDMGGVTAPLYKSESDDSLFQSTKDFIAYNYIKKIKYNISTPEAGNKVVQQATAETEYDDKNIIALCENATIIDISKNWEQSDGDVDRLALSSTDTYKCGKYYINGGLESIINNLTNSKTCNNYVSDLNEFKIDPNQLTVYINNTKVFENGVKTTNPYGYKYVCYVPKKSIVNAEVTGIVDKTYTGNEITQDVTVKVADKTLVKNVDYTVSYDKNVEIGTATIIITGIGDYSDEIKKTFEIKKEESEAGQGGNSGGGTGDQSTGGNTGTGSGDQNGKPGDASGGNQSKPTESQNPSGGNETSDQKKEPGVGTFIDGGTILIDESGVRYKVSSKVKNTELKKNDRVADKKSGGKYKITKIIKNKKTGKVSGGNLEYVAPYNKNTKLISATGKVKIAGVTFTVTSIGNNCAKGCTKLTKVVLGNYITNIGKNAFSGCSSLKTIQIKSKKLKKVGSNAFKGINKKAVISVPKTKKKVYIKLLKGKGQPVTVKIK